MGVGVLVSVGTGAWGRGLVNAGFSRSGVVDVGLYVLVGIGKGILASVGLRVTRL